MRKTKSFRTNNNNKFKYDSTVSKADIQKYFRLLHKPADQTVPNQLAPNQPVPPTTQHTPLYQQNPPPPISFNKIHLPLNQQMVPSYSEFGCYNCYNYGEVRPCCSNNQQPLQYHVDQPPPPIADTTKIGSTIQQQKWIGGIKKNFLPLNIQSMFYEPPKPDTPPSKIWPFGFDPVWSETAAEDSPKIIDSVIYQTLIRSF